MRSSAAIRPRQRVSDVAIEMHDPNRRGRTPRVAIGAAAAGLTSAALFNRYKTDQAERRMPPLGQFIDIDGVRLHSLDLGQGRPVVMLHGNAAMIQHMLVSGLVFAAAERYRVNCVRRHGR